MASVHKLELLDSTITANTAGSSTTLETQQVRQIAVITVTNWNGTTLTGALQHSADGTNWEDAATFTVVTGNTYESVQVSVELLPRVRANLTSVTVTSADVKVDLFYDKAK